MDYVVRGIAFSDVDIVTMAASIFLWQHYSESDFFLGGLVSAAVLTTLSAKPYKSAHASIAFKGIGSMTNAGGKVLLAAKITVPSQTALARG